MLDNIKLQSLTEEEIVNEEYTLESLWILKCGQQQIGPFHTVQLKEYSEKNHDFFESIEATNLLKEHFILFYQNVEFQRRKPSLVQSSSLVKDSSFHILKNGQKEGPFDFNDIESRIKSRDVSLGDLLSVDKGQTWIKIYEHHQFDRRSRAKASELPFSPNDTINQKTIKSNKESLLKAQKKKEEEDALAGLAFLSHGHEHAKKAENFKANSWVRATKPSRKFNIKIAASLAVALLISFTTVMKEKRGSSGVPRLVETEKKEIDNRPRKAKRVPASDKKVTNRAKEQKRTANPSKFRSSKAKKKITEIERKKPKRYIPKKEPQRITHFADEFDERLEGDQDIREPASVTKPNFYPEDELTQEQIEAIELGDPERLEREEQHY